jgi:hypothetical protein
VKARAAHVVGDLQLGPRKAGEDVERFHLGDGLEHGREHAQSPAAASEPLQGVPNRAYPTDGDERDEDVDLVRRGDLQRKLSTEGGFGPVACQ